jgi:signal transduction histidine kinase
VEAGTERLVQTGDVPPKPITSRWLPRLEHLHERDVRHVAQIIVVVRVTVVASVGALVLFGERYSEHPVLVTLALLMSLGYSLLLLGNEQLEMRYTRTAGLVTGLDLGLAIVLVWLTGGIGSPVIAVLLLIVVVAALRHPPAGALLTAAVTAFAIFATATFSGRSEVTFPVGVLALWWPLYALITAALTVALSILVEREHEFRLRADLEAEEEHAAAEEERDLRQRLLDAYQAQQDGLRVILHEFRTPVISLTGLTEALSDTDHPMTPANAATTARIAREQSRHLQDMLAALGDVAISWRPAFASGRVRDVVLEELAGAAGSAAGVPGERLVVRVPAGATARTDAQALTRIVTNLVENAARHSGTAPVEVEMSADADHLEVRILDRGPGVPVSVHGDLSRMYTSVGNKHGTAGLGLWIVQQIVDAFGGRLTFANRDGGGLMVDVSLPLARRSLSSPSEPEG